MSHSDEPPATPEPHPSGGVDSPAAAPPTARERRRAARDEMQMQLRTFNSQLKALTPRYLVGPVLAAINVAVFIVMVASGVDALAPNALELQAWGANFGPLTQTGEWWRLLTCTFVHIGWLHLLLNMLVLLLLGNTVERLLGHGPFLGLYLVSGLAGSVASLAAHPLLTSAGASGAVFGLMGAELAFLVRHRGALPPIAVRQLLVGGAVMVFNNLGFGQENIDVAGHLGGLAAGFALGLAIAVPPTVEAVPARARRAAVVLVPALLLVGAAALAVPRTGTQALQAWDQFAVAEAPIMERFTALFAEAQQGGLSDTAAAERIERDLLVPFRAAVAAYDRDVGEIPDEVATQMAQLRQYMDLRVRGWEAMIDGLRNQNTPRFEEGMTLHEQAVQILDQLAAAANGS